MQFGYINVSAEFNTKSLAVRMEMKIFPENKLQPTTFAMTALTKPEIIAKNVNTHKRAHL